MNFAVATLCMKMSSKWIAVTNLFKGHVFVENFLMGLATVGAFSIGEYPEGVAVMLFSRIGEFFQDLKELF